MTQKNQQASLIIEKLPKVQKPSLIQLEEDNVIALRFRCSSGKIINGRFHKDEIIANVTKQIQWELEITSPIQLVIMNKKLEPGKTLLQSNILNRTTVCVEVD